MGCEVLAIGTELLLGQVVDTNSAWIGERLAAAGIPCYQQSSVGDNHARIVAALRSALSRADTVICCGGLGPTPDDITREAIAEVMGVSLVRDPAIEGWLSDRFAGRGMPESNYKQADRPLGSSVIMPRIGTAPGLVCPVEGKVVYAVPGVPAEMREMVEGAIVPDLRRRLGSAVTIRSRYLRVWGVPESKVAAAVAPRVQALEERGNPTIAFLASAAEGVRVRVTARASGTSPEDAEQAAVAMLDAEEVELRALLGDSVGGVDDESLEGAVGDLLGRLGWRLAVAESLTGGLVAQRLTTVAGASTWFTGGLVSYSDRAKRALLGVGEGPVVSERAARQMAAGAAALLAADVGLALTGVAGPSTQEGQPVGTVFVGVCVRDPTGGAGQESRALQLLLSGDRQAVRQRAATAALDLLRRTLLDLPAKIGMDCARQAPGGLS